MVELPSQQPIWYKKRNYVHFDSPLKRDDAIRLVSNPDVVARHGFFPLISFNAKQRQWKRATNRWKIKSRPIAYASHSDSHIFSYYSWLLYEKYEIELTSQGLSDVVLAYRKHLVDPEKNDRGKTNFHFAAEAFADIACRPDCEVIALLIFE